MKRLENSNFAKGVLRSPITLAIVAHLQACGPCRMADIDKMLAGVDGWPRNAATAKLARVMNKLRESHHVHRVLRNDEMWWAHGAHPLTVDPVAERRVQASAAGAVVPAPCIDLMRGPPYVPDAGPALRPGALDYKRCASHGVRC